LNTAGGHSVESAERKEKIFSLLLNKRCYVNTQTSQTEPSRTGGGHSVESAKKKTELFRLTPKRRRQNPRIQPLAIRLNMLEKRKLFSLSLQKS
jgi:pyruvate/2-oxoacid:ferredoxin oxidoreductase beta subunit